MSASMTSSNGPPGPDDDVSAAPVPVVELDPGVSPGPVELSSTPIVTSTLPVVLPAEMLPVEMLPTEVLPVDAHSAGAHAMLVPDDVGLPVVSTPLLLPTVVVSTTNHGLAMVQPPTTANSPLPTHPHTRLSMALLDHKQRPDAPTN